MEKGLVLCGGGSLGAYEAGAYQYLLEKNYSFSIMTGTSIGALNAAMYAANDFEENLEIWKNITIKSVLQNGVDLNPASLKGFSRETRKELINYAQDYLWYGGGDVTPLEELISTHFHPQKLKDSGVRVGIVTVRFPSFEEVDILLNEVENDMMKEYLIASAACYPVLPIKWIHGKAYLDGGYRNNLPIDYALRLGAEEIVAIELHGWPKTPQHPELRDLPFVTLITPSRKTGSFFDFTRNIVDESITLGYLDAKKALKDSYGFSYTFKKTRNLDSFARDLTKMLLYRGHIYDYHRLQEVLTYQGVTPSSELDVFLRTAEMAGDWLNVPYLEEYDIRFYLKLCVKKMMEHAKTLKTYDFFKISKNKTRLLSKNRLDFLSCLYHEAKEGSHLSTYERLTANSPECASFIALALLLKERNLLS